MSDTTGPQQLFDLWKRQFDESAKNWATLMGQVPAAPEAATFWRPMFDQGLQHWARILAQTPVTPDVMTQWKAFMDQSIEAWSRALGQMSNTEAFAQMLGRSLDQFLTTQAPIKKAAEQSVEAGLQALNLPSRTQVAAVAKQIMDLEDRIEKLEDVIASLVRRLPPAGRTGGEDPPPARAATGRKAT